MKIRGKSIMIIFILIFFMISCKDSKSNNYTGNSDRDIFEVAADTDTDDHAQDSDSDSLECPEGYEGTPPDCTKIIEEGALYIAPNGDDSNPGTITAPFKTFRPALSLAEPGDVIFVRGGAYGAGNSMITGSWFESKDEDQQNCPVNSTLKNDNCYFDRQEMIGINDFSGWTGHSNPMDKKYQVSNGTAQSPITIAAYPGETPVLDVRSFSRSKCAVSIQNKSFWIIEGLEIIGGKVCVGMFAADDSHDITIRNNDIHDVIIKGNGNPGLVRISSGIREGESVQNIFIHNNKLHGIYDIDEPDKGWSGLVDMQHFGAVTLMSKEAYMMDQEGYLHNGTRNIEIIGNEIYNVPQAFFFKNVMAGPVIIEDNTIYDSESLGTLCASNVTMDNNTVYGVEKGWWKVGGSCSANATRSEDLIAINAQDITIKNNTFVGMNSLFNLNIGGSHEISNNVFFGMNGMPGPGTNRPAYIKTLYNVDSANTKDSFLHRISSDNNCFISDDPGFLFVYRNSEQYTSPSFLVTKMTLLNTL